MIGRIAFWLFLAFATLYVTVTRGHFWSTDEVAVYQQTVGLVNTDSYAVQPMNNAVQGVGGKWYAPYGAGQSIAVVPLYLIGWGVSRFGSKRVVAVLSGSNISNGDVHWGGTPEIFFVNLFNCFVVAALISMFFLTSIRLGSRVRPALVASVLVGLTSHIAGFSAGFFQHGMEALLILTAFYSMLSSQSMYGLFASGVCIGAAIFTRIPTLALVPGLMLYLAVSWIGRIRNGKVMALESGVFLLPISLYCLFTAGVNYNKFGVYSLTGSYAALVPFTTPFYVGLYGYLLSPGASLFLFSPLLLLGFWYVKPFYFKNPVETVSISVMALTYLLMYSHAYLWHGQWAFGPRYLVAIVPLLLLPLGQWLGSKRLADSFFKKLVTVTLMLAGLVIQVLSVSVNVAYVYAKEGYATFQPPYGFLFDPRYSQIGAHWRALMAGDYRVDFWLLNVYRQFGAGTMLWILVPLMGILAVCTYQLIKATRIGGKANGTS